MRGDIAEDRAKNRLWLLLTLSVLIFAGGIVLYLSLPLSSRSQQSYLAAVFDLQKDLRRTNDGRPRVLLVGGSSLGFSVSARQLTSELGVQVVNLGLDAAIGYSRIWGLYRDYMNPKTDLIVLSPEYGMLAADQRLLPVFCDVVFLSKSPAMLLKNPLCAPVVVGREMADLFYFAFSTGRHDKVYFRSALDRFGDVVSHIGLPGHPAEIRAPNVDTVTPDRLRQFMSFVRNEIIGRGYQVVVIPTIVPQEACDTELGEMASIYRHLRKLNTVKAKDARHIKPEFCFSKRKFFDTAYHLNESGRLEKTHIFSRYLKAAIGELGSEFVTSSR